MNTLFNHLDENAYIQIFSSFRLTESQLQQEVMVMMSTCFKMNGYFVEFGATDGKTLSNTLLLETYLKWEGILVEPSKGYHKALGENRKCIIDKRCVYSESNKHVEFSENKNSRELSTIKKYLPTLRTAQGSLNIQRALKLNNSKKEVYPVETVSLLDLLDQHNAPKLIDYISIDTEGSEFDILNAFDFNKYQFRLLTVEHNYEEQREQIHNLLIKNGYRRILPQISEYDDWYINEAINKSTDKNN